MRDEFRRICTEYGGSVDAVASVDGGAKCTQAGQALEGPIAGDDRTVDVYVVTASKETTEELSPSFDTVLAAVGD